MDATIVTPMRSSAPKDLLLGGTGTACTRPEQVPDVEKASSTDSTQQPRRVIFPTLHSQAPAAEHREEADPSNVSDGAVGAGDKNLPVSSLARRRRQPSQSLPEDEREALTAKLQHILPLSPMLSGTSAEKNEENVTRSLPVLPELVPLPSSASVSVSSAIHSRRSTPPRPSERRTKFAQAQGSLLLETPITPMVRRHTSYFRLGESCPVKLPLLHDKQSGATQLRPNSSVKRVTSCPTATPSSILRVGKFCGTSSCSPTNNSVGPKTARNGKMLPISSVASDMPSLASSSSAESIGLLDDSSEELRVSFDARVWVREFKRSRDEDIWYSKSDMERFQNEAVERIQQYSSELIPTGTGRMVQRDASATTFPKVLFTHAALREDPDFLGQSRSSLPKLTDCRKQDVAKREIQKILVVDPRGVCRALFTKAFNLLVPHATIKTASCARDAISVALTEDFDVVVVEERLEVPAESNASPSADTSGCILLRQLQALSYKRRARLYIGMSTHVMEDHERLKANGADLVWKKPPPIMNATLLDQLLAILLWKRTSLTQ